MHDLNAVVISAGVLSSGGVSNLNPDKVLVHHFRDSSPAEILAISCLTIPDLTEVHSFAIWP